MTLPRILAVILAVLLVALLVFLAFAWRSSIKPIEPQSRPVFDAASIEKGAALARIGNCISCHTADGGKAYAGGRAIETPYGTLYATNITPDPRTGVGRWSLEAFARSMREGVDREGRHLYPAFPYENFTRLSDADLAALYSYIMSREPVEARTPKPKLPFPLNVRMLLAGWKLLFLDKGPYRPQPAQSAQWNRGAYLVQGLAHCGACHTPRNFLGAEKKRRALAGGETSGWHAPALDAASPSPEPWSAEQLFAYLRRGYAEKHSVPAGPMAPVVRNLARAPEGDVRAIAVYVASLGADRREESASQGASGPAKAADRTGKAIYEGACASCHEPGREGGGALRLSSSSALAMPTPENLIHIVRDGIIPLEGSRGPWMPAYGAAFTDAQLVALARYLRAELAKQPAWDKLEERVPKILRGES